jgi:hypothetical protein
MALTLIRMCFSVVSSGLIDMMIVTYTYLQALRVAEPVGPPPVPAGNQEVHEYDEEAEGEEVDVEMEVIHEDEDSEEEEDEEEDDGCMEVEKEWGMMSPTELREWKEWREWQEHGDGRQKPKAADDGDGWHGKEEQREWQAAKAERWSSGWDWQDVKDEHGYEEEGRKAADGIQRMRNKRKIEAGKLPPPPPPPQLQPDHDGICRTAAPWAKSNAKAAADIGHLANNNREQRVPGQAWVHPETGEHLWTSEEAGVTFVSGMGRGPGKRTRGQGSVAKAKAKWLAKTATSGSRGSGKGRQTEGGWQGGKGKAEGGWKGGKGKAGKGTVTGKGKGFDNGKGQTSVRQTDLTSHAMEASCIVWSVLLFFRLHNVGMSIR